MKIDFQQKLNMIYHATYVPTHYYIKSNLKAVYPSLSLPDDYLEHYKDRLLSAHDDILYLTTKEFAYLGICRNPHTGESVILGPVCSTPLSDEAIDHLISAYSLPVQMRLQIIDFFHQTPLFTLDQFLNILALVYTEMTGTAIDIFEQFGIVNHEREEEIGNVHSRSLYERKEEQHYHDTYFFEQAYYGFVERGDLNGLKDFMKTVPPLGIGSVAQDSLRQSKNIFITSVALMTRRAIAGGLDIETAYQLSDSYIQEAERMTDATAITLLNATATMDFTRRVSDAKIPSGMSPDVFRAIQFISNHINRDISVRDVAKELKMDRSTLSRKFKKELGFNISSYIMRRKLEEARSLLHYTDKTISEISEYLCFSTQSYFQNVFRKKYGCTPREYRKSATRSDTDVR
ncbi:MAG: AraC family transcriptional regulator [Lachnospiraceae bacterium]|nr:AraC family transcriptional regulator [Lachnospiraceae bacterium]